MPLEIIGNLDDGTKRNILETLENLFLKYPEADRNLLGEIRTANRPYDFIWSLGFRLDSKREVFDSSSGLILELNEFRFSNPQHFKSEMDRTGFLLELPKVVPYVIGQAFGYLLDINLGLISGKLSRTKIRKEDYDKYTSDLEYLKIIKAKTMDRMREEDEEDISEIPEDRLFADAVADDFIGKGREVTKHVLREYKRLVGEIISQA